VSALFDRENPLRRHPRDDDTAEIPGPATIDPYDPRPHLRPRRV